MRLYIGNKKNKIIEQVSYKTLNNITKEEFDEKVKNSLEELQEYMSQFF